MAILIHHPHHRFLGVVETDIVDGSVAFEHLDARHRSRGPRQHGAQQDGQRLGR
jgi:hypothetical protein